MAQRVSDRIQRAFGSRENADRLFLDLPVGKVQITFRSSFVSPFFADRIPSLNARVQAARQTRSG